MIKSEKQYDIAIDFLNYLHDLNIIKWNTAVSATNKLRDNFDYKYGRCDDCEYRWKDCECNKIHQRYYR